MRHAHDDLTGVDDLTRLRQGLDDHAIPVRNQDGVTCFIASNIRPGLGRIELRSRRLGVSLGLVIGRCRNRAAGDEIAVAGLVIRSLARSRPRSDNGLLVRTHGEP